MKDMKKIGYYMIGGILATIIDMSLLYIFTDILHIHYLFSQGLSFGISFVVGFLFQKYITFQNKSSNHIKQ
jgi:putative flippase GtrA